MKDMGAEGSIRANIGKDSQVLPMQDCGLSRGEFLQFTFTECITELGHKVLVYSVVAFITGLVDQVEVSKDKPFDSCLKLKPAQANQGEMWVF